MFWDYLVNNPECIHQLMQLFSDRGTPASARHMNGYSGHTFKWVKKDGSFVYVQIHMITDQGIKNFTIEEATKLAGENPDYLTQDLSKTLKRVTTLVDVLCADHDTRAGRSCAIQRV